MPDRARQRSLGPNLRIVRLEQPANYRTDPEPYYARIQTFLEEVARREAARAAAQIDAGPQLPDPWTDDDVANSEIANVLGIDAGVRARQGETTMMNLKRFRLAFVWSGCALALAVTGAPAAAQDAGVPPYESRFAEANGIRLQYMDFGGSGLPLIFVQDIHNYFEHEDPFFQRDLRSAFYTRFTDDHRVLATVKRGYGESADPGWGYDVATHSEDLLGLMDALDIRRAVLVGRAPATQDLTWIAEHHPERVAGLVYLGNPVVIRSSQNPEARLFDENYARGSCDLQERGIALVGARTSWRPHFLDDETVRIDVPSLRFTHPVWNRRSMDLQRLDRLDAIAAWEPECPGHAQSLEYFRALAADPARRAALREALEASDLSVPIDEGIQRAFGASMRTIVEPDPWEGGLPAFHDFIEPHMRSFLEDVQHTHAQGAQPDTAEVMAAAESFLTAFNNLEWDAFHASFAPSATVFQPFREPWRNNDREEIAAFFGSLFEEIRSSSEGPPYMRITPRDLRIEMLDDAGIVTFHLPGRERVGRRTLVFGRKQSTDPWRLFHLHASSLERPESQAGGGAAAHDLDPEAARRYAGRYALQTGDAPRMTVVFRPGDDGGLEAELGGQSRALRYLAGHAFQEVESGFLFVFNVERDGQAMGITGLSPELDRVEVFLRVEDER
ncbi:MAG TPA: nuclear transport factor 2 family protein [Gemmatimonadota bacterium]|nr:nuclear transport factor 2 family protein [Gemmatimonadota bacterium]